MSLDPSLAAAFDDELLQPVGHDSHAADLSEPMDYGDSVVMAASVHAAATLIAAQISLCDDISRLDLSTLRPSFVIDYAKQFYREIHKEPW